MSTLDTATANALPEDYYLTNFHALLSFVDRTYRELLTADEHAWLAAFRASSEAAQRLYVRLIGRKGCVFRLGRLDYPEIENITAAGTELTRRGLAVTEAPADLRTLLGAFRRNEIIGRLELKSLRQRPRAAIVDHLLASDDVADIEAWCRTLATGEDWIQLHGHAHVSLFTLCFFGNLRQDMSEFVLSDIGAVRYEAYAMPANARAFESRDQLEAHRCYFECEGLLEHDDPRDGDALLERVASLPARRPDDALLNRRIDRLCNGVARQLERLDRHDAALRLYAESRHPPARERRVRLYLAAEQRREALALCQEMQSGPLAESELQFVERVYRRLDRSGERSASENQGLKVARRPFRPLTNRIVLHPGKGRVEQVAREFYARYGESYYVENSLICGVLGLFIWDIVFLSLPGAFFHPFQSAPNDFRESGFRAARASAISKRFRELDSPDRFRQRVVETWQQKVGIANPLVNWSRLSEPLLMRALERIPGSNWQAMFDRLLSDTRENTSGLPDLVLFREEGGYEFIEIKGPGDALQSNQRRWMQYFARHGISCRVVNVSWASKGDC